MKNLKKKLALAAAFFLAAQTVLSAGTAALAAELPESMDKTALVFEENTEAVEATAEIAPDEEEAAEKDCGEANTVGENVNPEEVPESGAAGVSGEDDHTAGAVEISPVEAAVAVEKSVPDEWSNEAFLGENAEAAEEDFDPDFAEAGFTIDEETGYILPEYVADPVVIEEAEAGMPLLLGGAEEDLSSYDGRNSYTEAKNQKSFNTCWAFSTIALAEANMVKKGSAEKDTVDYSEHGLVYSMYNDETIVDPLGLTAGDHVTISGSTYAGIGGNPVYAMMSLSGWKGVQEESEIPYDEIGTGATYTSKQCFTDAAQLRNGYVYPMTGLLNGEKVWLDPTGTGKSYMDELKRAIKQYGGATIEYLYETGGGEYSYYHKTEEDANHSVAIVGWDDALSRENFKRSGSGGDIMPEKDGAWLIRDSHGAGSGDGGYCWLSYYDRSIGSYSYVMEFEQPGTYEHNYHYDGTGGNSVNTIGDRLNKISIKAGSPVFVSGTEYKSKTLSYAKDSDNPSIRENGYTLGYLQHGGSVGNVYQSSDTPQEIRAVSIGLGSSDVTVSIQIYTKSGPMSDPTDGTPAYRTEIKRTTGKEGIYTYDVDPVYLAPHTWFSVVITVATTEGSVIRVYTDKTLSNGGLSFINKTAAGQSFIKSTSGSKWADYSLTDCSQAVNENTVTGPDAAGYYHYEVKYSMRSWTSRIKALTVDVPLRRIFTVDDEVIAPVEGTAEIHYQKSPADAEWGTITCTSDNTDVATVSADDSGVIRVRALKKGTANITVTANYPGGSLQDTCQVRAVYRPEDMYFSSSSTSVSKGSTAQLKPVFEFITGEGRKITDCYVDDYTFRWESDDTSAVSVTPRDNGKTATIKGLKAGESAYVSVYCVEKRLSADILVNVTSGGGGGGTGGGGGGAGGGGTVKKSAGPGQAAGTFSKNWFQDAAGLWKIKNKAGQIVTGAWLCDDAIVANGQNVWYLLDANGNMVSNGCVMDLTGNIYSLEMNHNGYFGMLRYQDGTYTCEDGTKVDLRFSHEHNGTFGAVINPEGIAFLKAKYGVTQFPIGNGNIIYSKSFE